MVHNFWYNDISIIYNKQFILEFLPLKNYSLTRKLNAVLRFSILYSIIIFIINREKSVFCFPLIIMIITMIIYNHNNPKNLDTINNFVNMNEPKYQSDSNLYPNLDNNIQYLIDGINTSCILPTENNPFMNNLLFTEDSNKEPCTTHDNASINSLMNSKFNDGIYIDSNNLFFNKNNSLRQFIPLPNGGKPMDTVAFANWCYGDNNTCKEGNVHDCDGSSYGRRAIVRAPRDKGISPLSSATVSTNAAAAAAAATAAASPSDANAAAAANAAATAAAAPGLGGWSGISRTPVGSGSD